MPHPRKLLLILFLTITAWACADSGGGTVGDRNPSGPGRKVLLLAIDGGGIRGIIPATILTRIEAHTGKRIHQLFDLIGGTSTGGIITLALTSPNPPEGGAPFTAQDLLNIYRKEGGKIFYKQPWTCAACATYYADDAGQNGIEPYLRSLVTAHRTLEEAGKYIQGQPGNRVRQAFTTAYTVNSKGDAVPNPRRGWDYGPYLFNTVDAALHKEDNYAIWEAARGTSAAPTYFPAAHVGGGQGGRSQAAERWVVDGGVMSNDPAVWAVSEALRTGIASELRDIVLVSLGTGIYIGDAGVGIHNNAGYTVPDSGNWGKAAWARTDMYNLTGEKSGSSPILNVLGYSGQLATEPQLRGFQAAGMQYYRLNPSLPLQHAGMDDISPANIDSLVAITERYIVNGPGKKTLDDILRSLGN